MNTFYTWLIKQNYRKDVVGILANCLYVDDFYEHLPKNKSKKNLVAYLVAQGAPVETIGHLRIAWDEYKQYRKALSTVNK